MHFEDEKDSDEDSEHNKRNSTHYCTCISSEYVGEAIFFLFKIGEAMLDPVVRLYIYHTTCDELYGSVSTKLQRARNPPSTARFPFGETAGILKPFT